MDIKKLELKEHENVEWILKAIPLKPKNIFTKKNHTDITCFDVSSELFVMGSNDGFCHIIYRQTNHLKSILIKKKSNISKIRIIRTIDLCVGISLETGEIFILIIPFHEFLVYSEAVIYTVPADHKCQISYLCWSKNSEKLFSGDINGVIYATHINFAEKTVETFRLVDCGSPIVQLYYDFKCLVISTEKENFIWDTDLSSRIQIGKKPRSDVGNYGGIILSKLTDKSDADLVIARPDNKIWVSDIQGVVKKSIILNQTALFSNEKCIAVLPSQTSQQIIKEQFDEKGNSRFRLNRISGLKGNDVIFWSSQGILWVNVASGQISGSSCRLGNILDISVVDISSLVYQDSWKTPYDDDSGNFFEIWIWRKPYEPGESRLLRLATIPLLITKLSIDGFYLSKKLPHQISQSSNSKHKPNIEIEAPSDINEKLDENDSTIDNHPEQDGSSMTMLYDNVYRITDKTRQLIKGSQDIILEKTGREEEEEGVEQAEEMTEEGLLEMPTESVKEEKEESVDNLEVPCQQIIRNRSPSPLIIPNSTKIYQPSDEASIQQNRYLNSRNIRVAELEDNNTPSPTVKSNSWEQTETKPSDTIDTESIRSTDITPVIVEDDINVEIKRVQEVIDAADEVIRKVNPDKEKPTEYPNLSTELSQASESQDPTSPYEEINSPSIVVSGYDIQKEKTRFDWSEYQKLKSYSIIEDEENEINNHREKCFSGSWKYTSESEIEQSNNTVSSVADSKKLSNSINDNESNKPLYELSGDSQLQEEYNYDEKNNSVEIIKSVEDKCESEVLHNVTQASSLEISKHEDKSATLNLQSVSDHPLSIYKSLSESEVDNTLFESDVSNELKDITDKVLTDRILTNSNKWIYHRGPSIQLMANKIQSLAVNLRIIWLSDNKGGLYVGVRDPDASLDESNYNQNVSTNQNNKKPFYWLQDLYLTTDQIITSPSGSIIYRGYNEEASVYTGLTKIWTSNVVKKKVLHKDNWSFAMQSIRSFDIDDNMAVVVTKKGELKVMNKISARDPYRKTQKASVAGTVTMATCLKGIIWCVTEVTIGTNPSKCLQHIFACTALQGNSSELSIVYWKMVPLTHELIDPSENGHAELHMNNQASTSMIHSIHLGTQQLAWLQTKDNRVFFCTGVTPETPNGNGLWFQLSLRTILELPASAEVGSILGGYDKRRSASILSSSPILLSCKTSPKDCSGNGVLWACNTEKTAPAILFESAKLILGHSWGDCFSDVRARNIMVGLPSLLEWRQVIQVPCGSGGKSVALWMVHKTKEIFCWWSRNKVRSISIPRNYGSLAWLVSCKHTVVALTHDAGKYLILIRIGISNENPTGVSWCPIKLPKLSEPPAHLTCTEKEIWFVQKDCLFTTRITSKIISDSSAHIEWRMIHIKLKDLQGKIGGLQVKSIKKSDDNNVSKSQNVDDKHAGVYFVWLLSDYDGQIYMGKWNHSDGTPGNIEWVFIPGPKAKMIRLSYSNLYMVEKGGNTSLFIRCGIDWLCNPSGTHWIDIPTSYGTKSGPILDISVATGHENCSYLAIIDGWGRMLKHDWMKVEGEFKESDIDSKTSSNDYEQHQPRHKDENPKPVQDHKDTSDVDWEILF